MGCCELAAPSYYSGNLLLLEDALRPEQLDYWTGIFDATFRAGGVRHTRLEWTGPAPSAAEQAVYQAAGYDLTTIVCLTAQAAVPVPRRNPDLAIRPLREEDLGPLKRLPAGHQSRLGRPVHGLHDR